MSVHIVNIALELTASGNNIVGETYILTCTLIGDRIDVDFQWLRQDHSMITSDNSTTVTTNSSFVSQLVFNPLQASHGGNIKCQIKINPDSTIMKQLNIVVNGMNLQVCTFLTIRYCFYSAPTILIDIIPNGTPIVEHMYTLNCSVYEYEKLANPTISYQWIKNNGIQTQVGNNPNTLVFSSLKLSDAGKYTCKVDIQSSYLSNGISINEIFVVKLKGKLAIELGL